jgi:hypothetical protein
MASTLFACKVHLEACLCCDSWDLLNMGGTVAGDAHVAQTISTWTLFVPLITGSDDDDSNLDVVQQPEI